MHNYKGSYLLLFELPFPRVMLILFNIDHIQGFHFMFKPFSQPISDIIIFDSCYPC